MKHASDYKNTPRTIKFESSLNDVLKKIIDEKKSRLLVTENDKITGIVTEKDLGVFLLTTFFGVASFFLPIFFVAFFLGAAFTFSVFSTGVFEPSIFTSSSSL
mgnify:CR=1 FL=1